MDGASYDLKNAAANAARRAPLFSEKAEVQLADVELEALLAGFLKCSHRGQVLLLVVLKRCDFTCNSENELRRVRDTCEKILSTVGVLREKNEAENQLGSSECVRAVLGYQFEKLVMLAEEVSRAVDAFLRE